ncbi:Endo-beta-mannanase [Limihaloglobus sulfuriphilus]|uniref:Endo-beta-mannanase n=1 Tax=Limihaloglobus sulfuriphilus TaxID=1851148 RepID=A0A1Q2MC76_9BACT|nr:cellulase family glycosylhydrolase [Limihaloglobus sulfuriphilus]AQQ69842.1 Endo-beta-mannanase [Limihaloglobus sulfuriphilus]
MNLSAFVLLTACSLLTAAIPAIRISEDGKGFVRSDTGEPFVVWGFNYDHDESGTLIEDYWDTKWDEVVGDFQEMKSYGANVVRIHLQLHRFMDSPDQPNAESLKTLERLVKLAEKTGLYLNITGLACYHKDMVPDWYNNVTEEQRWKIQAEFWENVAKICAAGSAIFCYDLMNEPVLPGNKQESDWLPGEGFGGKHFVQRISLCLNGRTRKQVAREWVDTLTAAIRKHDKDHLITVGAIPWAHTWPNAKPLFYSDEVAENLDFVSVHFYPKKDKAQKALDALAVYDIGKPLVIEEMFPLSCSIEQMDEFIEKSRPIAEGWITFYWGKQLDEYKKDDGLAEMIKKAWLEYFIHKTPEILDSSRDVMP